MAFLLTILAVIVLPMVIAAAGLWLRDFVGLSEMIADDMKADAKAFDGQPFTGKTVAAYFGNHGAAVAALANIVKSIIEDSKHDAQP